MSRINLNVKAPWQGLGKDAQGAKTLDEVLAMTDLNFDVVGSPISVNGQIVKDYQANVRSDNGEVLGIVGSRYEIVQNKEAFSFLDGMVQNGMEFVAGNIASNKARGWILGKLDGFSLMNDEVTPYIMFSNSYDGSSGIKLAVCMLRTWCSNGCSYLIPNVDFTWSIKHTRNANNKLELAQGNILRIGKYQNAFAEQMEILSQRRLPSIEELAEYLFPMPKEITNRTELNILNQRNMLMDIYNTKDDIAQFKGSLYGGYMAVTDFASHAEPLRQSQTYEETRFFKLMEGAKIVSEAQKYFERV